MRVYAEAVLLRNQILFGCLNGKLYQIDPASCTIQKVFQTDGSKHIYHRVTTMMELLEMISNYMAMI